MLKTPFGRLAGVLKLPHLGLVEEWEARQRQQKNDLHFRTCPQSHVFGKFGSSFRKTFFFAIAWKATIRPLASTAMTTQHRGVP